MGRSYRFARTVFEWEGDVARHFVGLPAAVADEIEATAGGGGGGVAGDRGAAGRCGPH